MFVIHINTLEMNNNKNEEDLDRCFLDDVLNKLYDFGDSPASKRKNKSQKKKRKRQVDEEDPRADEEDSLADGVQHQDSSATNHPDCSEAEITDSACQHHSPGVEVVTFQDPMKRLMTKKTQMAPVGPPVTKKKPELKEKQKPEESLDTFNLEKARLEVHRFGITGYKKEEQRVFEQERAIMLGAKPPKKEFLNYKVYQQKIKDKKQKAKEEVQTDLKKKKKQSKPRDEKRKSSSGGSAPTGQVGRFKNGMLVLSSKEIQTIKTSRVTK